MFLKISNLSKTYSNGVKALNNVSLEISNGMFGLLGPNGAGKSTMLRTLATLQNADSGSVFFENTDVLNQKEEVRKWLGYLPQDFGVYPWSTAYNFLDHLARLKGISDSEDRMNAVKEMLERVNLWENRKKKLKTFSGGMKQRFGIAQALIGNPKLIIVDEPTAGLDPAERNRFHNLLSEVAEDVIIIFSTHIVEDVKDICDSMAIINKGKILANGIPGILISEIEDRIWEKAIEKSELEKYEKDFKVISSQLKGGKKVIRIYSGNQPRNDFQLVKSTLEDVYFKKLYEDELEKGS